MRDVKVGFITLTEVTSEGDHRDYNAWHQLDHLPEQFSIPGVVCGQRWVLRPACAADALAVDDPLGTFHYLTMYLMTEPLAQTLDEFAEVRERVANSGASMSTAGPGCPARGCSSKRWRATFPRGTRRHPVAAQPGDLRRDRRAARPRGVLDEYLRLRHTRHFPQLLEVPGVAGLWSFATRRWGFARSEDPPPDPQAQDATRITVVFLDGDPLEVAAEVGPLVRDHWAGAPVRPRFAGPLQTITPWQWDWFDDDEVTR